MREREREREDRMDSVFILSSETGELLIEHQNPGSTTAGNKKKKRERERERDERERRIFKTSLLSYRGN